MNSQRELKPSQVSEGLGWLILFETWFIFLEYGSDSVAGCSGHM